MAESAYLVSALATGGLLLAVWAFVARAQDSRRYVPATGGGGRVARSGTDSTAAWTAGFVLLALGAGGVAVALVSDAAIGSALGGGWVALVALLGALLVAYLLWGTYQSARFRGLRSSQAALLSAWLFGTLFLLAVVAKLVTGG